MTRAITSVLIASAIALSGCPKKETIQPVIHVPSDTPDCPAACSHLRDLKCEEGSPLQDGTTCEKFCEDTQNSGHALKPSCVVRITKCSDMDHLDDFCPKN